jgi:hypothetical protein
MSRGTHLKVGNAPVLLNQKPQSVWIVQVGSRIYGEKPLAASLLTVFPEACNIFMFKSTLSMLRTIDWSRSLQITYKAAFLACESLTPSPKPVSLRLLYIVPIAKTRFSMALEWYSAWADKKPSGQFDENIPFHNRNKMIKVELMFRIFAWTAK